MEEFVNKVIKVNSPGILLADPMSEAGRKILGFHFARMINREAGTRSGEDIEALHDMRVAARRMRVALDLFGSFFKKKEVKMMVKEEKVPANLKVIEPYTEHKCPFCGTPLKLVEDWNKNRTYFCAYKHGNIYKPTETGEIKFISTKILI